MRSSPPQAPVVPVPQSTEAASCARRALRTFLDVPEHSDELAGWLGSPYARSDAEVVVSELVTNATEHGHAPVTLRLVIVDAGLRIEVTDGSSGVPRMPDLDHGRATGRGLRLVQSLSRAWGTDARGDGKVVWALMQV